MNSAAKIPIVLAIACLWASVIATTITFPLDFWLINPSTNIRYGMWTLCQDLKSSSGGTLCYSFYDPQTQNSLTNFYKAFQAFQCGMLGFSTLALFFILVSLSFCSKCWVLFFLNAILIAFAVGCGIVSLLIYGIKIYDPNTNIIGWCFWVSVGSGSLLAVALFFLIIYLIILGVVRDRSRKHKKTTTKETAVDTYDHETNKSIKSVPSYRQLQYQPSQDYRVDDPNMPRYLVRDADYRNSKRWHESPPRQYYPNDEPYNTIRPNPANQNPNWTFFDSTASQYHVSRSQV